MKTEGLSDSQLSKLADNCWLSAETVAKVISDTYKRNTVYYDNSNDLERLPTHIRKVSARSHRVRSNRIFRDTESVINGVIANPAKPNVMTGGNTPESAMLSETVEKHLLNRYSEIDLKGEIRRGLRHLYFGRLIVMKPYWDAAKNDWCAVALDPRKVRISKKAVKEDDADFIIEEVDTTLDQLIARFPEKEEDILKKFGNLEPVEWPTTDVTYRECWLGNSLVCKYQEIILDNRKNPYWDWDGIWLNDEEQKMMETGTVDMESVAGQQDERKLLMAAKNGEVKPEAEVPLDDVNLNAFYFNHFDRPRKPYVFATILNDERCPVGRTSFIEQAIPLQESLDRRKRQIDENAQFVNGWLKVDSSVMTKEQAEKIGYDTGGLVYGKGVLNGVARETGTALPQFIFQDMEDSRNEIDNIMGATSAFRGEREGRETKAGRLALIEQSYLNLNELVQVVDFVHSELFNWFYQLMKLNYTEAHYTKDIGRDGAVIETQLQRNSLTGNATIRVIPGRTLPEDKQFEYERAQADAQAGRIANLDYLKAAGYDNPTELDANAKAEGIANAQQELAMQVQSQPPKPTV